VIGDLLLRDLTEFPHRAVGDAIAADFDTGLAWNWMERDAFGFELRDPIPGWPEPAALDFWKEAGLGFHPLIRWFAITGCASPMSVARVPRAIAPESCVAALRACMAPAGMDQQLSIPYVLTPDRHRAFVLARAREDYSDEDLEVARRLQPLLVLLERQVQVLGGAPDGSRDGAGRGVLTGRERAVLVLLERGCTAEAIGRELGVSPRTVHKHLEHLYRKLGVSDRLRAVVVAKEARLLPDAAAGPPHLRAVGPDERTGRYTSRWSGRVPERGWATTDPDFEAFA
jgi:DNA-binding NarL/FixJ family response regulator